MCNNDLLTFVGMSFRHICMKGSLLICLKHFLNGELRSLKYFAQILVLGVLGSSTT